MWFYNGQLRVKTNEGQDFVLSDTLNNKKHSLVIKKILQRAHDEFHQRS